MKRLTPAVFFSGVVLLAAAGCSVSTPQRAIRPAVPPLRKAQQENIRLRCAAVKKLLAPLEIRGIGLYPRAFDSGYMPETICSFIKEAGFNRIYFHISSETELNDRLTEFLEAAEKFDLPVEIVLRQRDFYPRHRGNRLLRKMRGEYPGLPEAVRCVTDFNDALPDGAVKIDGVTVHLEPHTFTAPRAVPGQRFAWSDDSFGPGLDNDLLMAEALKTLRNIDCGSLPLTVAVPDFYQDLAAAGKLTRGTVKDFLDTRAKTPAVMLVSSGNKPTQLVAGTQTELAALGDEHRVLLGIELAGHVSSTRDKLRRRDWKDLVRILDFVISSHKKHPEFRGVVISPLSVFEYLIMEQD